MTGTNRRNDMSMVRQSKIKLIDKAVIDIGSNSVRLVVFRTSGSFLLPVFNEKVLAGLGRGLADTGKLNADGAKQALAALRRYRLILKARGVDAVRIVATAAVRSAGDGPDFVRIVANECGWDIEVLSGEDEARYSALGVIAAEPSGAGLVGDLGGSSLELVPINKGAVGTGISLPLGPLAMGIGEGDDTGQVEKHIDTALAQAEPQFNTQNIKNFYAVGGAWRSLALVNMELRGHPLRILNNYTIDRAEAFELAHLVRAQSAESLARIPGVSSRRAPHLPYAALLLERVLQRHMFKRVVVSAYGLREGLLYADLTSDERAEHPVLAGVRALAQQNWSSPGFGPQVERWLAPVADLFATPFGKSRTALLTAAACRLADLGARLHPDHRPELAFDIVLYAPFAGLTHGERAALALAVFHRYAGASAVPRAGLVAQLIDEPARIWALAMGQSLRCAASLSGRSAALLAQTHLQLEKGALGLCVDDEARDVLSPHTQKRLAAMAGALGLK